MDVILSRLDPRQLRVHCSDALQQELAKTFDLLALALEASKRAEEVQRASRKLDVNDFVADAALLERLEQIDSLRLQLSISIDRIVRSAKGKSPHDGLQSLKHEESAVNGLQSILELTDAANSSLASALSLTADVIDLSAAERADESGVIPASLSRKRKLSASLFSEQPQPLSTATAAAKKFVPAFKHVSPTSRLGKAIQTAFAFSLDVKKRKTDDRLQSFVPLSEKTAVIAKHLESVSPAALAEAMDALAYLVTVEVSILTKSTVTVKRHVALKALRAVQDVQSKFPAAAALFDKNVASLNKYMDLRFPLSMRATDDLKRRVRAALKEVSAWEIGQSSVMDLQEKMRFTKLVLDSNCEYWQPKADASVLKLLDTLLAQLDGFKDSQARVKRKETLLAWRAEVHVPLATKAARKPPVPLPISSNTNGGASPLSDDDVVNVLRQDIRPPPVPLRLSSSPVATKPTKQSLPNTNAKKAGGGTMHTASKNNKKKNKKKKKNKLKVPIAPSRLRLH